MHADLIYYYYNIIYYNINTLIYLNNINSILNIAPY